MYKVGKRLLAMLLSVCMILGMADFSVLKVQAAPINLADSSTSVSLSTGSYTYDGNIKEPTVTFVYAGGRAINAGEYTIDGYFDADGGGNIVGPITAKAGKKAVRIKGNTADVVGEYTKNYDVSPKAIGSASVKLTKIEDQKYDQGKPISPPSIELMDGSILLSGVHVDGEATTVEDAKGRADLDYYYICSNNTAVGRANITIHGLNNYANMKQDNYQIRARDFSKDADIMWGTALFIYREGEAQFPNITIVDKENGPISDYSVKYLENGLEHNCIDAGKINIHVTGTGNYIGSSANGTYIIQKNISDYESDFDVSVIPDQTYTGQEICPKVTITDKKTNGSRKTLVEGVDYELEYVANIDVGTATVNIIGKDSTQGGCYFGQISREFEIVGRGFGNGVTVEVDKTNLIYDGLAHEPGVKISIGTEELILGTDYKLEYSNNQNAGTGKVTIIALPGGNLTGQTDVTFTIAKKPLNDTDIAVLVEPPENPIYDGTGKFPKSVKLEYHTSRNGTLTIVDDEYTVSYSANTAASDKATVTITANEKNYTGNTKKTFTINPANIAQADDGTDTEVVGIKDQYFTGSEITQNFNVIRGGKTLTKGANYDYDVEYSANKNVDEVTVTIKGTNNYYGTITKKFRILQKDISEKEITCKWTAGGAFSYTSEGIEPQITVQYLSGSNLITLQSPADFTVDYSQNIDVTKEAKAVVKGVGNYTGEVEMSFEITPRNISENGGKNLLHVIPQGENPGATFYNFWEAAIVPKDIEMRYQFNETRTPLLNLGSDYELEFKNNDTIGKATVIVTGNNNYTGTVTINDAFHIKGSLANETEVTIQEIPDEVYTGDPIEPDIEMEAWGKKLVKDIDYELDYEFNTDPGNTATVTITAKEGGNYWIPSGQPITRTFKIVKKNLGDEKGAGPITVSFQDAPYIYTGESIKPTIKVEYNVNGINKKELEEGVDYYPVWDNNEEASEKVGKMATVTIMAVEDSNFEGETLPVSFEIEQRELTDSTVEVPILENPLLYDGKNAVSYESITVNYKNTEDGIEFPELNYAPGAPDNEYRYKYEDNDKVGDGTLVIEGTGNFKGTVRKTFMVQGDLQNAFIGKIADQIYTGYPIEPELDITCYKVSLEAGKDYSVTYEVNENADDKPVVTISAGTSGYYINSGEDPERDPITTTFEIKKKDISEAFGEGSGIMVSNIDEDGYLYTGSLIEPEPVLDYKAYENDPERPAKRMEEGEVEVQEIDGELRKVIIGGDYSIFYKNNTNVPAEDAKTSDLPTITIDAEGSRNYEGSVEVTFKINPRQIGTELAGDLLAAYTYDEEFLEYIYDPIYEGNVEQDSEGYDRIGVQDVKVRYTGNRVKNAEPITFNDLRVYYDYTKEITGGDQLQLSPYDPRQGTGHRYDYTISYVDNKKVGEATLIIEGHGNYEGTKTFTFKIYGDLMEGLKDGNTKVDDIPPQPYSVIEVKPDAVVRYGNQVLVEAEKDGDGNYIKDGAGDYRLEYKNNINVSAGKNLAEEEKPTVTITGVNYFAGVINKTFVITIRNFTTHPDGMSLTNIDAGFEYTAYAIRPGDVESGFPAIKLLNNGHEVDSGEYAIIGYVNNVNAASKDAEKAPGIRIQGTGGNYTGIMTLTFEIYGISLSKGNSKINIEVDDQNYYWTDEGDEDREGDAGITTKVKITRPDSKDSEKLVTLREGTDYDLSWENNRNVKSSYEAEPPTVTITGKNNYKDVNPISFTIHPRSLEANKDDLTFKIADKPYTGALILPEKDEVEVYDNGHRLEEGKDYQRSMGEQCTNAWQPGLLKITGINNYEEAIDAEFVITPKSIEDVREMEITNILDKVYSTKELEQGQLAVTWKHMEPVEEPEPEEEEQEEEEQEEDFPAYVETGEETLLRPENKEIEDREEGKDYDYVLTYRNNIDVGTETAAVIVTGVGNYTGTREVNFSIDAKEFTEEEFSMDIPNQVYKSGGVSPIPKVVFILDPDAEEREEYELTYGKDFTIDLEKGVHGYENNIAVGKETATVFITGINNFAGELNTAFTIVGDIETAVVSAIGILDYTGEPVEPTPEVTMDGTQLVLGRDYELDYENNVNAGKNAVLLIKGIDNYGGVKRVTFIIGRDFAIDLEVTGIAPSYLYTGSPIAPVPVKVVAYGYTLKSGIDYTLSYSNNVNAGTAKLTVTGIGIYSGTGIFEYQIARRNLAQCTVTKPKGAAYTGKSLSPAISVKYGDTVLKAGTDYKVVFINNLTPGKAKVIINGAGNNYSGSQVLSFDISLAKASGVKATPKSTNKIKLSWKKSSGATGYEIFNTANKRVASVPKGTSYTIAGLKAGAAYNYKVRSYVIKNGQRYYSAFTSTVKTATKPALPKVTVKSTKSKVANISWKAVSGASGYEVYQSTKKGSGYRKIAATTKKSYTKKKLASKKRYYYKVRAYKVINGKKIYSSFSSVNYVIIK